MIKDISEKKKKTHEKRGLGLETEPERDKQALLWPAKHAEGPLGSHAVSGRELWTSAPPVCDMGALNQLTPETPGGPEVLGFSDSRTDGGIWGMPGALGTRRGEAAWTCPQHPNSPVGAPRPGHEAEFKNNNNSGLIRKKSVEFQLQQRKQLHLTVILSQAAGAGRTRASRGSQGVEGCPGGSRHLLCLRVPRAQHRAGAQGPASEASLALNVWGRKAGAERLGASQWEEWEAGTGLLCPEAGKPRGWDSF